MFEQGTPEHELGNLLAPEIVRLKIGLKECAKKDCENFGLIECPTKRILEAFDKYVQTLQKV